MKQNVRPARVLEAKAIAWLRGSAGRPRRSFPLFHFMRAVGAGCTALRPNATLARPINYPGHTAALARTPHTRLTKQVCPW